GAKFGIGGGWIAFLFTVAAFVGATIAGAGIRTSERMLRGATWLAIAAAVLLFIGNVIASGSMRILSFNFTALALVSTLLALASIAISAVASGSGRARIRVLAVPVVALLVIVALAGDFGLSYVPTHLWGGLSLTLVVALTGIGASLPLGILLALG